MRQFLGRVLANESYGPRCRRIRVAAPERAVRYAPGQFFHIRCGRGTDPLLRRPFSVYAVEADADGWVRHLDFLFIVIGHGTRSLAERAPGDMLDLLGPLGVGFRPPPEPARHVMVAGGVGIAPFYDLAEHLLERSRVRSPRSESRGDRTGDLGPGTLDPAADRPRITLLFGARAKDELYGLRDLDRLGIEIRASTDDGSHGRKGLVTEMLEELLDAEVRSPKSKVQSHPQSHSTLDAGPRTSDCAIQVYGCGPAPMLDRVAGIVQARGVPCQLSLDRRMGCGLGACGACVCKVKVEDDPEGWNYIRICRAGPVVDAHRLVL